LDNFRFADDRETGPIGTSSGEGEPRTSHSLLWFVVVRQS
jgi:hypothetical protein